MTMLTTDNPKLMLNIINKKMAQIMDLITSDKLRDNIGSASLEYLKESEYHMYDAMSKVFCQDCV